MGVKILSEDALSQLSESRRKQYERDLRAEQQIGALIGTIDQLDAAGISPKKPKMPTVLPAEGTEVAEIKPMKAVDYQVSVSVPEEGKTPVFRRIKAVDIHPQVVQVPLPAVPVKQFAPVDVGQVKLPVMGNLDVNPPSYQPPEDIETILPAAAVLIPQTPVSFQSPKIDWEEMQAHTAPVTIPNLKMSPIRVPEQPITDLPDLSGIELPKFQYIKPCSFDVNLPVIGAVPHHNVLFVKPEKPIQVELPVMQPALPIIDITFHKPEIPDIDLPAAKLPPATASVNYVKPEPVTVALPDMNMTHEIESITYKQPQIHTMEIPKLEQPVVPTLSFQALEPVMSDLPQVKLPDVKISAIKEINCQLTALPSVKVIKPAVKAFAAPVPQEVNIPVVMLPKNPGRAFQALEPIAIQLPTVPLPKAPEIRLKPVQAVKREEYNFPEGDVIDLSPTFEKLNNFLSVLQGGQGGREGKDI